MSFVFFALPFACGREGLAGVSPGNNVDIGNLAPVDSCDIAQIRDFGPMFF
jgi:hypothetical protein